MNPANPTDTADIEAIRAAHAQDIIAFLEDITFGNWQECLDIAVFRYEETGSLLWLAVADGIRVMLRQEQYLAARRPPPPDGTDDTLPL